MSELLKRIEINERPITIDKFKRFIDDKSQNVTTHRKSITNLVDGIKETKRIDYIDNILSFDIETTSLYSCENNKYNAIAGTMYIWQLGIDGTCTYGRKWEEFIDLMNYIIDKFATNEFRRLVIWVHNLNFEFNFIQYYFNWIDLFAMSAKSPVRCCTDTGLEFRCSYALSGASLSYVGENLTIYDVKKLDGSLFDYSKKRGSTTPLSDYEMDYAMHDILVVMAYIDEVFQTEKTNNAQVRMTKTARVRQLLKKNCLYNKYSRLDYKDKMDKLKILNEKEYLMIKSSFQGGFTHSNRYNTNKTIDAKNYGYIDSFDISSSYPTVLCSELFPYRNLGFSLKTYTEDDILKLESKKYGAVFMIEMWNVNNTSYSDSIISESKCSDIVNAQSNNGRILHADHITMTITNIDFQVIKWFYKWDKCKIYNVQLYKMAYLPHNFIYTVLKLYSDKTKLKGISEEKAMELYGLSLTEAEAKYTMAKADLNSCYGDTAMDVNHVVITMDDKYEWHETKGDIIEVLKKYNKSSTRYNSYSWSTFCTAYARRNVLSAIHYIDEYCSNNNCNSFYLYTDTDSVKLFNAELVLDFFNEYNTKIIEKVKRCLRARNIDEAMAEPETVDGIKKPLGVWECETRDIEGYIFTKDNMKISNKKSIVKFKTLGAKRYIYETIDGKIHITIAGVNKKKGAEYFQSLKDPFKEFTFGMKIDEDHCGRSIAHYFNETVKGSFIDYLGNEQYYEEMSGICLTPSVFEIRRNNIYEKILSMSKQEIGIRV